MQDRGRLGNLARLADRTLRFVGGGYVEKSERASHGFLGEDVGGPYRNHTVTQRMVSHVVGYGTSPLLAFFDAILPSKRAPVADMPADKQLSQMPGGGTKKTNQKKSKTTKTRRGGGGKQKSKQKGKRGRQKSKSQTQKGTNLGAQTQRLKVEDAPVSQGTSSKNMGMMMKFSAGPRVGCMRIEGRIYVGDMCAAGSAGNNFVVFCPGGVTTKMMNHWSAMPQSSFYFGSPVSTFSQLFERYKLFTKLEYRPRTNTGTSGNFKFLYNEDPVAMWALTGIGQTVDTTQAGALTNSYTTAHFAGFPQVAETICWRQFETDWSYSFYGQDMNYTTATSYTGVINPAAVAAYDVRSAIAGTWAFTGSGFKGVTDNTTSQIGELWVNYDLTLCDLVTSAYTQAPTLDGKITTGRKTVSSIDTMLPMIINALREGKKKPDDEMRIHLG
jgi:hypothetical protein